MRLIYGTEEEHLQTIKNAIENNIDNIWTGDITRNKYLQENLKYAVANDLLEINEKIDYEDQSSYFLLKWKNNK